MRSTGFLPGLPYTELIIKLEAKMQAAAEALNLRGRHNPHGRWFVVSFSHFHNVTLHYNFTLHLAIPA